jgi:eukaryotic-like serine/threonine-protein kinase
MHVTDLDVLPGSGNRPLVGRTRELAGLRAALREAIAGRGRLILVAGEPGIGKTRLAEELSARARSEGAHVLWGRCWEGRGAPAYWPWVQVIRGYARGRSATRLAAELGACAPFVTHLVPELRVRLTDVAPTPPASDSEEARFALLDAVTEFLCAASLETPLVLVLDDLHEADAPSLLLLQFLVRALPSARLLVVGTYRDVGAGPPAEVAALLSGLVRVAQHMTLRGLDVDDVAHLLERETGALEEERAASIWQATGGNPLFLLQVIRLLADDPLQTDSPEVRVPLPPGVRETVRARVAALPPGAVDTLTTAAVAGDEPSVPLLRAISDRGPEALLADLATAVDAGLLVELPGSPGRFRFVHSLVRDALYEALDPSARPRLHLDVGRGLERLHEASPAAHLAALAHHFCRASPAGGAERGVDYAVRAAEQAAALLAWEEAAAHYRLALETAELAEGPRLERRCDILLGLGAAEQRAGRAEQARTVLVRAAALARDLEDPRRLADAAVRFAATEATMGAVDERAVELLEEALRRLPAGEGPLRARLLARLARALYFGDERERRVDASRRAVEIARSGDDPAALLEALCAEHVITWDADNATERLRSATEIVELAERLGDGEAAVQGHLWRRRHLLELGDALAAEHETGVCERLARQLRQPRYLWHATNLETGRALLAGRFEEAERLARKALEIGRAGRGATAEAVYLFHMRVVCAEQGRLQELAPRIDRLAELHAAWRFEPLHHLVRLDRRAEVEARFERLASRGFTDLPEDMFSLWYLAHLADACAYLGDRRRAAVLYARLLPYRERCLVMGESGGTEGALAQSIARLAVVLERWDDAAEQFELALQIHTRLGARPLLAHTRHEYAAVLHERGRADDLDRASRMLSEAASTAEELGMTVLAGRIRATEAALGPQAPVFRRDGEYWTIGFEGAPVRLRNERGLAYLAYLLARPNERIHALELAALGRSQPLNAPTRLDDGSATLRVGLGDAGELLDERAKSEYRRRLGELREELEEAESWGDPERAAKLSTEIDFLTRELAQALGLRGRDRRAASPAERARISVTKAITRARAKLAEHDESLGEHLGATIRTGTFCSYAPGPAAPGTWLTSREAPEHAPQPPATRP